MQTRVRSATFGRTAAQVEVESTPSPESRMTVGLPVPLHAMYMRWPSTAKVPAGGVAAAAGFDGASSPQPASATAAGPRFRRERALVQPEAEQVPARREAGARVRSSDQEQSARRPG